MTAAYVETRGKGAGSWVSEKLFMGRTFPDYLVSLVTPFNAVAAFILMVGGVATWQRFTQGLAASTNLSDNNPWGLWIGFDILCGVALAAGGYTIAAAAYVLKLDDYHAIVRPAILTGFLGYSFFVVGLLFDLGRPWRLPYPFVVSPGITSVMFSVGLHVMLYLTCLFIEFLPVAFEWLGWPRFRHWVLKLTFWVTVFGVMLSTLHQAALGGLFLLAPGKLHPLWYSQLLPIFFFVSSAFAGLSMVIIENMLSHRIFANQVDPAQHAKLERLTIGLARAAAVIMFMYFWLKALGFVHGLGFNYLTTPLGYWFIFEMIGLVLLPSFLYLLGARNRSVKLIRFTAVLTVIGIIVNRFNVSMIAFNWQLDDRYFPRWSEIAVTLMIITLFILTFRWIVNRMPVLHAHPDFEPEH